MKKFELTEEFIEDGAIHCNTQEEYDNMIEYFKNNIDIDMEGITPFDFNNIYITDFLGRVFYESACLYEDSNYDIIEWTDYMPQNKQISFENIDTVNDKYELNYYLQKDMDKYIKENRKNILFINNENICLEDIPNLINWLQDVYAYGQQVLEEESKIEYVDFQTALQWMKQGGKTKLCSYTYYIEDDCLRIKESETKIMQLTLQEIESKEWILIKE